MQLYTIRYTTQALVARYDEKGKLVSRTALGNPIVMTALPYQTAMRYSGNDNFEIESYIPDPRKPRNQVSTSRRGIGNGTKEVDWDAVSTAPEKGRDLKASKTLGKSAVQRAAETGDMGAAING